MKKLEIKYLKDCPCKKLVILFVVSMLLAGGLWWYTEKVQKPALKPLYDSLQKSNTSPSTDLD